MEAFRLDAPCKDYLWGGTRLVTDFGKKTDKAKAAESWELSCHKDGPSVIADGKYAGQTLEAYLEAQGKAVLGSNGQKFENFPILIKLIDAKDNLSVQVHPGDEYAMRVEGEYGKTEMWYIVDAEPGAELIYGFAHETTREAFRDAIEENKLEGIVNHVPVKKGEVYFIPAGTLHAIGKGLLIAEVQQNSNTTYRVYDYGRVGPDGKPRALHVDKAVEVTTLAPPPGSGKPQGEVQSVSGGSRTLLASCKYFTVERLETSGEMELTVGADSFQSLLVLEGSAELRQNGERLTLAKGSSAFLPAGSGTYTLSGRAEVLCSRV